MTETHSSPAQETGEPHVPASPQGLRTLVVNGERRTSASATLAELLMEAGYGDAKVATAVNGEFVAARGRAAMALADGDHVEIVAPRQGG